MQKTLIALSVLVTFSIYTLHAQENSPYTRFGLGTFNNGLFTSQQSVGGLSAAYNSPLSLNYQNPAALGKLVATCFEVDAYGARTQEKSKDTSSTFGNAAPVAIAIGFPILPSRWGAMIGVQSASSTSYNIYQETSFPYTGGSSTIAQQQTGTGGAYRFFMAHGFRIKIDSNNLIFIGARLEYMFGNIISTNLLIFPDSINTYNARQSSFSRMSGFVAGGGFLYETHIKKHTLTLGANVTLPSDVNINQYSQWDRFVDRSVGNGGIRDTILPTNTNGNMHLPLMGSVGITWAYTNKDKEHRLRDYNKWMVGVQYDMAQWQNYRYLGAPDSLGKSWKLSIGAEYRPDFTAIDNYWARVKYRFGAYMAQLPVYLQNTTLKSYAVTAGLGLPLPGWLSEIGIGLEVGTQGIVKNNLLRENFVRLHVGFTLNDKWFQHRKFE